MAEKRILVVDDDRDLRAILHGRLSAAGYETDFAEDGAGAITQAVKDPPDLIVLDIGLPAGDGFVVLERLQANSRLSHVPVIVVTAREPDGNEQRCLDSGAAAFYQKPVEGQELLNAIAQAMGQE